MATIELAIGPELKIKHPHCMKEHVNMNAPLSTDHCGSIALHNIMHLGIDILYGNQELNDSVVIQYH